MAVSAMRRMALGALESLGSVDRPMVTLTSRVLSTVLPMRWDTTRASSMEVSGKMMRTLAAVAASIVAVARVELEDIASRVSSSFPFSCPWCHCIS
jgi:hypothetical protein